MKGISSSELIRLLRDVDAPLSRRLRACKTMGELGYQMFGPVLLWAARNETARLRQEADAALRMIPGPWSFIRMRDCARQRGTSLMKKLGVKSRGELLRIVVDERRTLEERTKACSALGDLRFRGASDSLVSMLQNENLFLANAAANSLRQIGDSSLAPTFERIIRRSTKPNAREEAVYVLGSLGKMASSRNLSIHVLTNALKLLKNG